MESGSALNSDSREFEIPLIYEKGTPVNSYFELQKEGIQLLQKLEDQEVRVVFNVSISVDIHSFTSQFAHKCQAGRIKS